MRRRLSLPPAGNDWRSSNPMTVARPIPDVPHRTVDHRRNQRGQANYMAHRSMSMTLNPPLRNWMFFTCRRSGAVRAQVVDRSRTPRRLQQTRTAEDAARIHEPRPRTWGRDVRGWRPARLRQCVMGADAGLRIQIEAVHRLTEFGAVVSQRDAGSVRSGISPRSGERSTW